MIEKMEMGEILNMSVSRIFFGTANPPISTAQDSAFDLLDSVLASGINAFDCARSYGLAENTIGKWIENRKCRDRIIILSKCGDVKNGKVLVNRKVIMEQLQQSLEALRLDSIDIYLLHRDDPNTSIEEFIDTLNEIKAAGKIKVFGVSNWRYQRIEAANNYAKSKNLTGLQVSSPNYGLALQIKDLWGGGCVTISGSENEAARSWYIENQMPVIAYSSLGRGFFSGRFKSGDYESARLYLDTFAQKGYLYEENMQRLRRAEEVAKKYNVSVPEIAMRYVFSSQMNIFAIISTTSIKRLQMNIQAVNNPLNLNDVKYLESRE